MHEGHVSPARPKKDLDEILAYYERETSRGVADRFEEEFRAGRGISWEVAVDEILRPYDGLTIKVSP